MAEKKPFLLRREESLAEWCATTAQRLEMSENAFLNKILRDFKGAAEQLPIEKLREVMNPNG